MSAYEIMPAGEGQRPAIVFLMDGLGYRAALKTMAERLASHATTGGDGATADASATVRA